MEGTQFFSIEVEQTDRICPIGEIVAQDNKTNGKIPVFSCEGACIRGEIARLAANLVAKQEPYRRACHGEFLTVPGSTMSAWVKEASKVVLIDGCFLKCHGRLMGKLFEDRRLEHFDALSIYKKYTDRFDVDSVSDEEKKRVAQEVARWIIQSLVSKDGKSE